MSKSFKILVAKMSPEARHRAEQKTQELLKEIEMLVSETAIASKDNQESEGRPPPPPLESAE
jgi:hypothetical protein